MKVDYEGISIECDFCERTINKDNAYTWLVNGKPANRRFCSSLCLVKYEAKMNLKEKLDEEEKENAVQ